MKTAEPDIYRVVMFEGPPSLCDEPSIRGLDDQWYERAADLVNEIDRNRCWRCGAGVGYLLAGDADERVDWTFAALVSGPGTDAVSVQCEECCPDALDSPWSEPAPGVAS